VPCSRGCCASPAEHYRSLVARVGEPKSKVTVEDTPDTVNTVTEHWNDRQDVHVAVKRPFNHAPMQES
jgi:hypothetical protein